MTKEESWPSGEPDFRGADAGASSGEREGFLLEGAGPSAGSSLEEPEELPATAPPGAGGKPPAPPAKKERSGLVEALILVLIALVLALTLKTYVAEAYEIKGKSMLPTFRDGERVVVLKALYAIARGDIVVFGSKEEPGKDLIKRVVGLPGEFVKIVGGKVYINGKKIDESYDTLPDRDYRDRPIEKRIDLDHYYVLGDNRPDSHDSRSFESIPASSIKGKVVVRWWPFTKITSF